MSSHVYGLQSTNSINRIMDSFSQFPSSTIIAITKYMYNIIVFISHLLLYVKLFSFLIIQVTFFVLIMCSWLVMQYAGYLLGTEEERTIFVFKYLYAMIIICYRFSIEVMVVRTGNVDSGLLPFEFPHTCMNSC